MIALIVVGFGIFGLTRLRLNLYPDVSFPTITVYTVYEGVAPEDMETLITRPLEETVSSISGVLSLRSLSSQSTSVIKLYFDWGTDLFEAQNEVRKQIDFVRRTLPLDAEQPIVFTYDPNQEPFVVLALQSTTRSPRDLRTLSSQRLEPQIERMEGVASATTLGGLDREINIQIDPLKLQTYGVTLAEVANTLRAENVQVPGGEIVEGRMIYSLRTLGEFKSVGQIAETVIANVDGKPVRLSDLARVEDGIAQPIGGVHVDGGSGIIINIYRRSDANIVTTAASVVDGMNELKKLLPAGTELRVLTNQSDFIEQSVSNLYWTGLQAVILVVLILLFFLQSGRSATIIAVSIPTSIITTFAVMDWADLSLNVISLSGLTLAVGMVVDDAVVVLENIFQFKREGKSARKSAIDGAKEVALPVIVSTLTTLIVFLPILFVPGIPGVLFGDLALTISFSLSISSLVALTLIPLMASRFFKTETKKSLPLFTKLGNSIRGFLDRLEKTYVSQLHFVLKHPYLLLLVALMFFGATTPLFYQLKGEFFPEVDESAFILEIQREPGVNLFELERSIEQVERIIEEVVPEARLVVSEFGDKEGVEGAESPGGFTGQVRVELVPPSQRQRNQFDISASVLRELESIPGIKVNELRENPLSPDGENGLIVHLFGFDPLERKKISDEVTPLLTDIDGILSVSNTGEIGRPELRVNMDRERIARVGLTTSDVANTISNAIKGNVATTFVDQGISFDVRVELDPAFKNASTRLEDIQVRTQDGIYMPLKNLARVQEYTGPTNILRINQERVSELRLNLEGIDLKTASDQVRTILDQYPFPDGYRFELGGTAEEQAQSFYYLMIAFMIAGVLTYMVMASQFENLLEPFIILITIPLAMSGVLLALWITDTAVSVTAMIGLILLAGIVVNNGIVMIDYIKILRSRGMELGSAIEAGASRRLRPILMTAGTTILSMIPLALELGAGSETWSPMARSVIGGLSVSTLLMLFVVPAFYKVLVLLAEKIGFNTHVNNDPLAQEVTYEN